MTTASGLSSFDPFDQSYLADPYPTLARVRESSAAWFVEKHSFYLLTRYADVVAASKRYDIFSSTGGVGIEWKSRPMMPMYDPPQHTKLRRMVASFFTPRAVESYASAIRHAAETAIDRAIEKGRADLIRDVAETISITTLATVLGIPAEHQGDLRRWADNTMAELAGGDVSDEQAAALESTRKEFIRYLRGTIEERRKSDNDDLISVLLRANETDALTEKEVVAFCVLLLVAGFEPSASALGNVAHVLVTKLPSLDALPEHREGLAVAAEELLRFDSSVHAFFRNTLAETVVGDVTIPKQSKVMLHFAAANRDPTVFADADTLILTRTPNPHVAFGAGPHHCLGAPIARLQIPTFLELLRTRVKTVEPCEPEQRHDNLLFRGLKRWIVRLVPR